MAYFAPNGCQNLKRSLDRLARRMIVTSQLWSNLFKIVTMKVRVAALGAMRDVAWLMKMIFLATLTAYQRP